MKGWTNVGSLEELMDRFPTDDSCIPALFELKWPHGYRCPNCHHIRAYVIQTRRLPLYECSACQRQTSLTAGTILEGSRTSLRKWIVAIWLVSRRDAGINAVRLSSIIEVTYKTAWAMLHKIRTAISCADEQEQLEYNVHGFIAYYGSSRQYSCFELTAQEYPLIVAASLGPDDKEQEYKMKLVNRQHMSGKLLLPTGCADFTEQHVCPLAAAVSIIRQRFRVKHNSPLYTVFRRAKRWLCDTFRGISGKYLQRYLDEFCYRENAAARHATGWGTLGEICFARNGARERYLNRTTTLRGQSRYLASA